MNRSTILLALLTKVKALIEQLHISMQKDLVDVALAHIGKDASPNDLAPDELGCAETVTTLLKKVYPETPILVSTYALYDYLRNPANGYKQVWDAEVWPEGAIIISPTGFGRAGTHGHVGITLSGERIASNSSATGTFEQNYTHESWKAYYCDKLGYPNFLFIRVKK